MKPVKMIMAICVVSVLLVLPYGVSLGAERPLVISFRGDAVTLDPHGREEGTTLSILGNIFDTLVRFDYNLKIIPDLAISWKKVNDNTWEFKLRQGVKFHNGETFTAKSAKFSLERAKTLPQSQMKGSAPDYKEIIIVDNYTLRLVTEAPQPETILMLGNIYMVPETYYSEKSPEYVATNPVGSGAYKFIKWVKNDRIELVANESWYRGPTGFKEVIIRPISEDTTRVAALISGEIDVCEAVPVQDIPRVEQNKGTYVNRAESYRVIFVQFDVSSEKGGMTPNYQPGLPEGKPNPFKDIRVRKAVAHAINVDDIIKSVMGGSAYPASNIISPLCFGYNPKIERPKYDLNLAKSLLKEAGYENGFVANFDVPNDRYINDYLVGEVITGQLAKIGIKLNLNIAPKAVWVPIIFNYKSPFWLLGWGHMSWNTTFNQFFRVKQGAYGRTNLGRLNDPALEKRISEANGTIDEAKRKKLCQEIMADTMALHYVVPLYYQENVIGYSKRVKGKTRVNENIFAYDITPIK